MCIRDSTLSVRYCFHHSRVLQSGSCTTFRQRSEWKTTRHQSSQHSALEEQQTCLSTLRPFIRAKWSRHAMAWESPTLKTQSTNLYLCYRMWTMWIQWLQKKSAVTFVLYSGWSYAQRHWISKLHGHYKSQWENSREPFSEPTAPSIGSTGKSKHRRL